MAVYIEDIIDDIADYIDANLGANLTTIETEKDDGVPLDDFKEVVVGEADPILLDKVPSCRVYPTDIRVEQTAMGQDTITMILEFMGIITGSNRSNLTTATLRYFEAFRALLLSDVTLGGAVDVIGSTIEMQYIPTLSGDNERKVFIVSATFQKEVARS